MKFLKRSNPLRKQKNLSLICTLNKNWIKFKGYGWETLSYVCKLCRLTMGDGVSICVLCKSPSPFVYISRWGLECIQGRDLETDYSDHEAFFRTKFFFFLWYKDSYSIWKVISSTMSKYWNLKEHFLIIRCKFPKKNLKIEHK